MDLRSRVMVICLSRRSRPSRLRREGPIVLAGAAAGGALVYLLDPGLGRRRRQVARERLRAVPRRGARRARHGLRAASVQTAGRARGLVHGLAPGPERPLDDVELAHKVESILFRDPAVPKGRMNINSEGGCVVLRGELEDPELMAELERRVRKIRGVRDVDNLLHLPGAPVPPRRPPDAAAGG
jgi:hypothetical protein